MKEGTLWHRKKTCQSRLLQTKKKKKKEKKKNVEQDGSKRASPGERP